MALQGLSAAHLEEIAALFTSVFNREPWYDTNLFLNHLFRMWQKDFASAEASRGLCGRPLHSFAPHPYNRLGIRKVEYYAA